MRHYFPIKNGVTRPFSKSGNRLRQRLSKNLIYFSNCPAAGVPNQKGWLKLFFGRVVLKCGDNPPVSPALEDIQPGEEWATAPRTKPKRDLSFFMGFCVAKGVKAMDDHGSGLEGGEQGGWNRFSPRQHRNMWILTLSSLAFQFLSLYFVLGVLCPIFVDLYRGMQITFPFPAHLVVALSDALFSGPMNPRWPILVLVPGMVAALFLLRRVIDSLISKDESYAPYWQGRLIVVSTSVCIIALIIILDGVVWLSSQWGGGTLH